jgi:hypothetical protein
LAANFNNYFFLQILVDIGGKNMIYDIHLGGIMTKKHFRPSYLAVFILICSWMISFLPAAGVAGEGWQTWPPREYLIKSLVKSVEETLKTYHPETGRFGTEPWVCGDQNVIFPLSVAWSMKDRANPYYHDKKLLQVIAKGGEALVDDQDENGMWLFLKKDYSTWGMIYMPWTYSRWIRAYVLVKDALPKASRAKWEKGLLLGFTGIRKQELERVHNIPCHHAMGLYIAGVAFKNEEWKKAAWDFQQKVMAEQSPDGYWSENSGPVVSYNMVYLDSLGTYYYFSKDPAVPEVLRRSVKFHSAVLWSDGTSAACIDERVIYHKSINIGNVGFSWSPEGRGFILSQLWKQTEGGTKLTGGDYAASLLLYGGKGEVVPLPSAEAQGVSIIGKNDAVIVRNKPWEWAFSAYTTKPIQNRWIQDRQNMVDVFHADLGLVGGGGNTKLQPYWSTFTIGDPGFLRHREGEEEPNFLPAIDLKWTADKAVITQSGNPTRMTLTYGDIECAVTVEIMPGERLAILSYEAPQGKNVEAHLPFLKIADSIKTEKGAELALGDAELVLDSKNIGKHFDFGRLRVVIPAGSSLRWPAKQHNPYTKDGHSELSDAKLVLVMPFEKTDTHRVMISVYR